MSDIYHDMNVMNLCHRATLTYLSNIASGMDSKISSTDKFRLFPAFIQVGRATALAIVDLVLQNVYNDSILRLRSPSRWFGSFYPTRSTELYSYLQRPSGGTAVIGPQPRVQLNLPSAVPTYFSLLRHQYIPCPFIEILGSNMGECIVPSISGVRGFHLHLLFYQPKDRHNM
jgi:hypothetical protein